MKKPKYKRVPTVCCLSSYKNGIEEHLQASAHLCEKKLKKGNETLRLITYRLQMGPVVERKRNGK